MSPILWTDPAKTCPYCGSADIEDLPLPLLRIVQWFCSCCGRSWSEKETER